MRQTHLQRVKALTQKTALRRTAALRKRRRGKRRTRSVNLTAPERFTRFEQLFRIGCVVCRDEGHGHVRAEIHHLRGHPWSGSGQRASDAHTIPLCSEHHRTGDGTDGRIGYHWSPAEFEDRYGTQGELLDQVDALIERMQSSAA